MLLMGFLFLFGVFLVGDFCVVFCAFFVFLFFVVVFGWVFLVCLLVFCCILGARCSSVVRAFAHGTIGHRIDPSWG